MDKPEKRIDLWLHGTDREIIERVKRRYGGSTTAAIRACIRIADEVVLKLDRHPLTPSE
jgi:hypothetical protein